MYCSTKCSKECHLWTGLVAFVIGSVILLQRFDIIPETTWQYLWPSILIVVGLKLMMAGGNNCCNSDTCEMPISKPVKKHVVKKRKVAKKK